MSLTCIHLELVWGQYYTNAIPTTIKSHTKWNNVVHVDVSIYLDFNSVGLIGFGFDVNCSYANRNVMFKYFNGYMYYNSTVDTLSGSENIPFG